MTQLNPIVVDLSHYDDVTDWDLVKAFPIRGVINKVTEALNPPDRTFAIRRPECAKRGILYGAYHFIRPGDPVAQADHFLASCGDLDGLLLALDYEDPHVPIANAKAFLARVIAKAGRQARFYLGGACRDQVAADDAFLAGHKLWHPQYGPVARIPRPWSAYWLWQFTGDGVGPTPHNVPGITIAGKGIDINSYAGTPDELAAQWAA
jgi:GH25 family lysozyme M1 (1,4-beta-N-acetylmuramidase)